MNNESLGLVMISVFGITTLFAWIIHLGFKGINKHKQDDKKGSGDMRGVYISLLALVVSIGLYLSAKIDNDALITKFQKGEDIYCYSNSFDSKWERVNKSDGWYLEEETLKHKDKGLKFGIYRCKESF
jgi:hypothetical protein